VYSIEYVSYRQGLYRIRIDTARSVSNTYRYGWWPYRPSPNSYKQMATLAIAIGNKNIHLWYIRHLLHVTGHVTTARTAFRHRSGFQAHPWGSRSLHGGCAAVVVVAVVVVVADVVVVNAEGVSVGNLVSGYALGCCDVTHEHKWSSSTNSHLRV